MSSVNVLNQLGEVVGTTVLNDEVWGIEPNQQAIFDAVMVYNSNSRQATSKTKKRDEVRGGGIKPWKQKGTGRARQGSTRSPQWRHGGVVFGPTGDQNHKIKMNKKVRELALKSALSTKLADNEVKIVENFKFEDHKTKSMVKCLSDLKAEGKTVIVFADDMDDNSLIAAYNIPTIYAVWVGFINVYTLLDCSNVIFTKGAVKEIEEVLINGTQD